MGHVRQRILTSRPAPAGTAVVTAFIGEHCPPAPSQPQADRSAGAAQRNVLLVLFALFLSPSLPAEDLAKEEALRWLGQKQRLTVVEAAALAQKFGAFQGPVATMALVELAVDVRQPVRAAAIATLVANAPSEAAPWPLKLAGSTAIPARVAGIELAAALDAAQLVPASGSASSAALSIPVIQKLSKDGDPRVRLAAAESAAGRPWPGATAPNAPTFTGWFSQWLTDQDPRVQVPAITGLAQARDLTKGQDLLLGRLGLPLTSEDASHRIVDGLLGAGMPAGTISEKLLKILSSNAHSDLRALSGELLARCAGIEAIPFLITALKASPGPRNAGVRAAIADTLGVLAPNDPALIKLVHQALVPLVVDAWWGTRCAALWALMRTANRDCVPLAIQGLQRETNDAVVDLLRAYTGQNLRTFAEWSGWWKAYGAAWKPGRTGTAGDESSIDFYEVTDRTSNVCFVFDTSGSMSEMQEVLDRRRGLREQRSRFDAATSELWGALRKLDPGTRFNVVYFDSQAESWQTAPLRASWRNKARFRDDLHLHAPGSATNLHDALLLGLDQPQVETLYVLTDGHPTAGDLQEPTQLAEAMLLHNLDRKRPARIHTVAFFIDPKESGDAKKLLEPLARRTGGIYRVIE
ncbi:hypothetical protein LBMAG53_40130 [Planctomycetota bacterium]|nr:hypothetical protein LBMAG53_40130 [Planctomycetota bacterium]